ncbi:ENHANCED DOWNY MILDEW 2, partial [Prunus dulcis]
CELKKGMASSDGEAEALPSTVSNYHFMDDRDEPISFHVLPFNGVKRNPETSYKSLCTHLSKVFSLYDVRHSHNDLLDHVLLIRDSVERDDALARSKDIQGTNDLRFVDNHIEHDMNDGAENESSDIDSLFSSVCAFCDDGGDLLWEVPKATQNYFCKNCKYKQHQCFACGKLGPSDKSAGAEVVPCFSAICGRFYHPRCVAKLLHRYNGVSAEELEKKIAMGGKIAFAKGGGSDGERLLIPRAWEGLLPKRILIYCTKHEMNEEGRTIIRDHLKFPDVEVKKTVTEENKKILTSESLVGREKVVSKKMVSLDELYRVTIPTERSEQKQKPSAEEVGGRNGDKVFSGFDSLRKVTINTASKKELKTFTSEEKKTPVGEHKWSSLRAMVKENVRRVSAMGISEAMRH